MERLQLEGIKTGYNRLPVAKDLSFSVAERELFALLGPSGAGKTTILKTIAGLLTPIDGRIFINGDDVTATAAEHRDAVLIFQKPLLFPFMNAGENVGFGLRMQGVTGKAARLRVDAMMELTGLAGLQSRRPHELSGGQQQRVALARGLVINPSILLMDEPLSNLDADLRQQMRRLILDVRTETGVTMLLVTHDQTEAMMVSDRIALLLDGGLRQIDTPQNLFNRPATAEVAKFFGCDNLLPGRVSNGFFENGLLRLPTRLPETNLALAAIRPEAIDLLPDARPDTLACTVDTVSFEGALTRVQILTEAMPLTVLARGQDILPGQRLWVRLDRERVHILPGDTASD